MSSFALDQVVKLIAAENADDHFDTIDTELKRIEGDLRRQLAILIRAQNTLNNRKKQRLNELHASSSQIVAAVIATMVYFKEHTVESLRSDMAKIRQRRDPMTYIVGPYRYNDLTIATSNNLPPIDGSIIMFGHQRNYDACCNFYKNLIRRVNEVLVDKAATVKLIKYIDGKMIIVIRIENSSEYRNELENYKRQASDWMNKRQADQINKRQADLSNKRKSLHSRANKRQSDQIKPPQTIDESIDELFALIRKTC